MEIDVIGYRSVEEKGKQYYVYTIRTNVAGRTYTVEKRYSDLLSLHKKLKKQLNTPSFPPKQIRNHDSKVLEARRIGLSNYFHVIARGNLFTKALLEFLDVHHFPANLDIAAEALQSQDYGETNSEGLGLDDVDSASHCAVIEYRGDPLFIDRYDTCGMIIKGVFKALYE